MASDVPASGGDALGLILAIRPLVHDRVVRHLVQRPLSGRTVVSGIDEGAPVLLVEFRVVTPVVVAGPARLLAEEHVPQMRLGAPDAVAQLPAAQELMAVAGGEAV